MYEKAIPKRQKYALFVFGIFMFFSASLCAQNLNFNFKNTSLKVVLQKITEQSAYDFAYSDALNVYEKVVTVSANNEKPELFFSRFFKAQGISYKIQLKQVFLTPQEIAPKINSKKSFEITGIILDDLKMPLPGASVQNIDSKTGVSSGIKGEFAINVSIGDRVRFSFLGLTTKEITVSSTENKYIIELESDNVTLTDVVVTGYQTLSKERATGSFAVVTSKDLGSKMQTNIMERLAGTVAGMTSYKGAVQIRGTSTISGTKTPLYVVDGTPYEGSLDAINPADITNVTVLKDATAASIYGARSANGVIVITTRQGVAGATKVSYNGSVKIIPLPDVNYDNLMSSSEFIDFQKELFNLNPGTRPAGYYLNEVRSLMYDRKEGKITEEQMNQQIDIYRTRDRTQQAKDLFLQNQVVHQHNLSFYGGTEKHNYAMSVNYMQKNPYEKVQKNDRLGFNIKNTFNFFKWFRADVGVLGSVVNEKNDIGFMGMSYYTGAGRASYVQFLDEQGNRLPWYPNKGQGEIDRLNSLGLLNESSYPLDELHKVQTNNKETYLNLNLNLNFKIIDGLTLDLRYQNEIGGTRAKTYYDKDAQIVKSMINDATQIVDGVITQNIPTGGQLTESTSNSDSYTMRAQLNYNKNIAEKHRIAVIAGAERRRVKSSGFGIYRVGYDDHSLSYKTIDEKMLSKTLTGTQSLSGNFTFSNKTPGIFYVENRYVSFYSNASYTYNKRLSFTASIRMDQSNLFGTDPKYQYRPLWSFGGHYIISENKFSWLDRLAVRATYGINGNIAKQSGPFLTVIDGGVNAWINDYSSKVQYPPNSGLRWEKTGVFNIGVDFNLLKSRLNGSIEFYNKSTTDLLYNKVTDPTSGWSSLMVNYGDMFNRGVEVSLFSKNIVKTNFVWSTLLNFSYNKNKITKLENSLTDAIYYVNNAQIREGMAMQSLYSVRYAGLNDKGEPQAYDKDGKIVDSFAKLKVDDLVYSGVTTPPYAAAMTNSLSYKGISLSFMFTYYGGHVMRGIYGNYIVGTGISANPDKLTGHFWKKPGDEADRTMAPAYKQGASANLQNIWKSADMHVQKGDYLKLSELILEYNIPSSILRKTFIKDIQVRAQAQNLWTWAANNQGLDPEVWSGLGWSSDRGTKIPATFSLGLTLNF